jgi:PAS domain-containing protein
VVNEYPGTGEPAGGGARLFAIARSVAGLGGHGKDRCRRADGIALYANRALLDYTGLTLKDVFEVTFRARVFHPDDVERLRQERAQALVGDRKQTRGFRRIDQQIKIALFRIVAGQNRSENARTR